MWKQIESFAFSAKFSHQWFTVSQWRKIPSKYIQKITRVCFFKKVLKQRVPSFKDTQRKVK